MNKFYLLIICCCCTYAATAQSTVYSERDYARKPVWIEMIKDTSVNFFEAEKAFKTYFRNHDKPEGEHEDIGEHEKREKNPSKRERREMQRENHMRMDVKRYEYWRDRMLPYVQPDGHILTPADRLKIWKDNSRKP